MKTRPTLRNHARFAVLWPIIYSNDGLSGHGTVRDLSLIGCQVKGMVPVSVGVVLQLSISPPHKEDKLCVEVARVLWVKGDQFGVEFQRLTPMDHRWLLRFLENAERRNSYRTVDQCSAVEDLAAKPLTLPLKD